MGVDKRHLVLGGQTIFSRSLHALSEVFETVVVSVALDHEDLPIGAHRVIRDEVPGYATLGGLVSVLRAVDTEWICAVACDMPMVNPRVLRYLVECKDDLDYVIPVLSTGPQPMHACYRKTCLPTFQDQVAKSDLRIQLVMKAPGLRGCQVPESDLVRVDPRLESFLNVNTPSDYEMVRKLMERRTNFL